MKEDNGVCWKYRLFPGKKHLYAVMLAMLLCTVGSQMSISQTVNMNSTLIEAVTRGDFIKVKEALKKGADPNAVDQDNKFAILFITKAPVVGMEFAGYAFLAHRNHEEIVRLLVKSGANVNVRDAEGDTPLKEAYLSGEMLLVHFLLKNGAIPTEEDKLWLPTCQPLRNDKRCITDIQNGWLPSLESALAYGADPNSKDDSGCPMIMLIPGLPVQKGTTKSHATTNDKKILAQRYDLHEQFVRLLVDYGAKIDVKNA